MRYYQCEKYPIEFVLSENIDKYFDCHNHVGHYVISLVMQGEVTVYLESRKVMCHEGDAFIIPPYVVHSVCQERDARLLSMCIGTAFARETDSETAEVIVRELLKNAVGQGIFGEAQKEKLLPFARTVFRGWDKGRKEMDTGIKNLADRITTHPELELPIATLAADIFVSKYYLIRKFKRSVGMTPHQFCIQNRIRKSQGLLDEEKTVSRIAAEMGFYDQSHFDKAFQKIVGISPSEYIHSKKQIGQST
ncbi:putative response regulatory protein [Lachnospiraceae bacterium]|nr:putative response regulatory protein [Lachnospiraceae bacterium]